MKPLPCSFVRSLRSLRSVGKAAAVVAAGLVGSLVPAQLQAAVIQDLYKIEVPVASYSSADRNRASREALSLIFKRTTPHTGDNLPAELSPALRRASDVMQGYRYLEQEGGLSLSVSFPPQAVQQMLNDAALPFWGARRPNLLLWVAVRDGEGREIMSDLSAGDQVTALRQAAARRALPVQLPLMDLTDSQQVFFSDVWARFDNVLEQASERYASDGFAVLRVSEQPDGLWQGDWQLSENQRVANGAVQGSTLDAAISNLIDSLANEMTSRYALRMEGGDNRERLLLSGIGGMADLVTASQALKTLSAVSDVDVIEINESGVVLGVKVIGGREGLQQALRLERRFSVVELPEPDPQEQAIDPTQTLQPVPGSALGLSYQWTP